MKKIFKKTIFYIASTIAEIGILVILTLFSLMARFSSKKLQNYALFIGMMHTNNMVYVAKAMRQKGYKVSVVPWLILPHEENVGYDVNLRKQYPFLYSNFVGQYFLSFWLFIWAIFNFDIFLLPFRNRLLDRTAWLKWLEIPLLHLAGKKVILNTYGGDVATPRLRRREDLKYSLYHGYMVDPQYNIYNEKAIARNTRILEQQADCIISAIDHIDYLDRVDEYFHLRCIDLDLFKPKFTTENEIPILVHAPNHRLVKGTHQIQEAVENLNKRGIKCELKIIENTPHAKLMDIIRESDIVVDQLLLGTYARLGIEAMALGKPVLCYLRDDLYQYNPIWKDCPVINVNPDTLEEVLEKVLTTSRKNWLKIGQSGRKYVETYHGYDYISERFDKIIKKIISV